MKKGESWKNWIIEEELGSGTFGTVYRVTRTEFGHTYESALKVIRIPQNQEDFNSMLNDGMSVEQAKEYYFGMVQDIVSEFALMSDLRGDSNIVSYEDHEVVEINGGQGWEIFIRMELLTPLYTYLRNNVFTVGDVVRLGIDMCKAIEVCEDNHIIHRDIKPDNIFISKRGLYKLGDFGIARQMEKTRSEMSKKGTPSYMAPEVVKCLPYDSTVDLYSLGIVLYRFLNNNRNPFMPPYPEKIHYSDKDRANTRRLIGEEMPAPCNSYPKLTEIVLKASAYKPENRYQSAFDMRRDLLALLHEPENDISIFPINISSSPSTMGSAASKFTQLNLAEDSAIEPSRSLSMSSIGGPSKKFQPEPDSRDGSADSSSVFDDDPTMTAPMPAPVMPAKTSEPSLAPEQSLAEEKSIAPEASLKEEAEPSAIGAAAAAGVEAFDIAADEDNEPTGARTSFMPESAGPEDAPDVDPFVEMEKFLNGGSAAGAEEPEDDEEINDTVFLDEEPSIYETEPLDAVEDVAADEKTSPAEMTVSAEKTAPAEKTLSVSDAGKGKVRKEQKAKTEKKKLSTGAKVAIAIVAAAIVAIPVIFLSMFHEVPSVSGMNSEQAKAAIEGAGMVYVEQGVFSDEFEAGAVISQNHEGDKMKKGSEVEVVVSRGTMITLPDLNGLSLKEATKKLEKLGLVIEVTDSKLSDTIAKDGVISQDPEAKTKCGKGDVIKVVTSAGITQVKVPDVKGKSESDAAKALKDAGLKSSSEYDYSDSVAAGNVISQSVEAGKEVDKNSTVTITVSQGSAPRATGGGGGGSKKKSKSKSKSKKKKSTSEASWS